MYCLLLKLGLLLRIIAKMAMLDSKRHPLSDQVQGVPRNMTVDK